MKGKLRRWAQGQGHRGFADRLARLCKPPKWINPLHKEESTHVSRHLKTRAILVLAAMTCCSIKDQLPGTSSGICPPNASISEQNRMFCWPPIVSRQASYTVSDNTKEAEGNLTSLPPVSQRKQTPCFKTLLIRTLVRAGFKRE